MAICSFFILLDGNASVYVNPRRKDEFRLLPASVISDTSQRRASVWRKGASGAAASGSGGAAQTQPMPADHRNAENVSVTTLIADAAAASKTETGTQETRGYGLSHTMSAPADLNRLLETNDDNVHEGTPYGCQPLISVSEVTPPATAATESDGSLIKRLVKHNSVPVGTLSSNDVIVENSGPPAPDWLPRTSLNPESRRASLAKYARSLSVDPIEVAPVKQRCSASNAALQRLRKSYYESQEKEKENLWRDDSGQINSDNTLTVASQQAAAGNTPSFEARVRSIGMSRCLANERRNLGKCVKTYGTRTVSNAYCLLCCFIIELCKIYSFYFEGPGSTFGEIALLNPYSSRNASVVADTACDLLVINNELYSKCIKACLRP